MTLRLPLAWAAAAAGGAVALAGCTPANSGNDGASGASATPNPTVSALAEAPAGTPDPCDALTLEQLNEITGTEMADGEFNSALSHDGRNICQWHPADLERAVPRVVVEINWAYPDATRHQELANAQLGETTPVEKEIEGAQHAYANPRGRTIGMEVNGDFVKVSFVQPGRKEGKQVTLKLARAVAANLAGIEAAG